MQHNQWYYFGLTDSNNDTRYYNCQLEGTLEDTVFSKSPDDFIKLINVCWNEKTKGENKERYVVKYSSVNKDHDNTLYIPKRFIDRIQLVKPGSIYEEAFS